MQGKYLPRIHLQKATPYHQTILGCLHNTPERVPDEGPTDLALELVEGVLGAADVGEAVGEAHALGSAKFVEERLLVGPDATGDEQATARR
jgi:hypothetical protein